MKSGDGRFTMAIRVRFQFDDANFMQDDPTSLHAHSPLAISDLSSGAVVRRAFFGVEGKAFNDFWYEFRLNGGGSNGSAGSGVTGGEGDPLVSLARVAYMGIDHFELNVGVIEPAFMFEGTTSSGQLMFLERPEIDNIAADTFGAGDCAPRHRSPLPEGQRHHAGRQSGPERRLHRRQDRYQLPATARAATSRPKLLGRASYRFWNDGASNAAIGASGARRLQPRQQRGRLQHAHLQDRPEIRVDGTRLISTGGITAKSAYMYAFDAGVNIDNFFLGGEWAQFDVRRSQAVISGVNFAADNPTFSGWYVEGSWVITGEPKTYTVSATNNEVGGFGAPKVATPFSWKGDSWGAWELTARYSDTDLNWHDQWRRTR